MKKYKVTVELTKEYEIEIDENKITEEILNHFEKYFRDLNEEDDRYKSMANDYCRLRAVGLQGSIEGYGFVLENGKVPFQAEFQGLGVDDITNGINFIEIDDGTDCPSIEVEEI